MMKHMKTDGNHTVQKVSGFVKKLKSNIARFEVYVPRGSSGHPEGPATGSGGKQTGPASGLFFDGQGKKSIAST